MLKRIKGYLSTPWASVVCMLVAVFVKGCLLKVFLLIGTDKLGQTIMTYNFLQGYGFSVNSSSLEDLATVIHVADNGWPPGYNLLFLFFTQLTGKNYVLASFLIDCLATLLFFWYCRKTLLLIRFPVWLTNLFLLFQGFFINSYLEYSPPTDFLSLAFLVAALYYLLKTLDSTTVSFRTVVPLTASLLCASFTRYQNIPVALLLLVVLIIIGCIQKRKGWWINGVIALTFLCLLCGGYFLYQQIHTGQAYYLVQGKKGFFLSNLTLMEPFMVTGTINSKFYALQLSNLSGIEYTTITSVIRWLGLLLAVAFTIVVSGYLLKKRGRVNNTQDGFFLFGFMAYLGTIGLLALLSLIHDQYIGPPVFNWTYVQDARYFAFPAFFVQVSAWWYLFVRPQNNKPHLMRWLKAGFILLMVFELLHSVYFLAKKSSTELATFRDRESERPEQAFIIRFIQEVQTKDPGRQVVVMSFEKRARYLANLYGASAMLKPQALNDRLPASSKPAVLLAVIPENELFLFHSFVQQPGVKRLTQIKKYSFYTYYVEPTSGNNQ